MNTKKYIIKTRLGLIFCLFLICQIHQSHGMDKQGMEVGSVIKIVVQQPEDLLHQYFDQHYIDTINKVGSQQVDTTKASLMGIETSFAKYWAGKLSAYECIKASNMFINQLLIDASKIETSRSGPNIHIFFKLFNQLIPQYRQVFKKEFRDTLPHNVLDELKNEISNTGDASHSAIFAQLDKLSSLKGQNSVELIELLWESWQLAKSIDNMESQNLTHQTDLKDKIQNSQLYGIDLNQGWGDAKRSRIFLYIYMMLLEDGLKSLDISRPDKM